MTDGIGVWATGVAAIIAFAVVFHLSGIVARVKKTLAIAREAASVMRAADLHDDEKERLIQRSAVRLFSEFALVTLISAAILAAPALIMVAADAMGLATFEAVSAFLLRWEIIIGTLVVFVALYLVAGRR